MEQNEFLRKDDEEEIDLMRLMWSLCRARKRIILMILLFAVIFSGAKGIKFLKERSDYLKASASGTGQAAQSESDRKVLESRLLTMEKAGRDIAGMQAYFENSYVMKIDPYSAAVAKTQYQVSPVQPEFPQQPGFEPKTPIGETVLRETGRPGPEQSQTPGTEEIPNPAGIAYARLLNTKGFLDSISAAVGMECRYMRELIAISAGEDGLLLVKVTADNLETAEMIMECINQKLPEQRSAVTALAGEHTVTKLSYDALITADNNIQNIQKAFTDRLTALQNSRAAAETEYNKILNNMKEEPEVSVRDGVKGCVKFALIGGFIGLFLGCVLVFCSSVLSTSLYSAEALKDRMNIRILGTLPVSPEKLSKESKLDLTLRRLEHRCADSDRAKCFRLAKSYVEQVYAELNPLEVALDAEGQVAVIGLAGEKWLSEAAEGLSGGGKIRFAAAGNILTDPLALEQLKNFRTVLLMEQTGVSDYAGIAKECAILSDLKKQVLGVVVAED